MKYKNNKKTKTILTSFSLLGATALATSAVIFTSSTLNKKENANNSLLSNNSLTRSITNNNENANKQGVTNPDEVFFSSKQNLNTLDPWNENDKNINEENVKTFEQFKKNLDTIQGTSDELTALKKITTDVENYIKYRKFQKNYFDSGLNKPVTEGGIPWDTIKQEVLDNFGAVESFNQIPNINEINEKLKLMSGICENASKIQLINPKKLKSFDVVNATPSQNLNNVSSVAGNDFNTLIKIAEIDLSKSADYVLDFIYTKANIQSQGKLIIRNNEGQLASSTLDVDYKNMDIFGRNMYVGSGKPTPNYNGTGANIKNRETFVLTKTNSTLNIMIRLKDNETLRDVEFSNEQGLEKPTKFGILDVQANDTQTFNDFISGSTTVGKLMDNNNNNNNQLKQIQFYSNQIWSKADSNQASIEAMNRTVEYYQAKNQNVKFSLNFITTYDATSGNGYKKLVAGGGSEAEILLNVSYDGTKSSLSPSPIPFYSDFIKELPEDIKKKNLTELSKISLNSKSNATVAQQTIKYANAFWKLGISFDGNGNVPLSDYEIEISNLTDKVFFEKPEFFDDNNATTLPETSTNIVEEKDKKEGVINALSSLYQDWWDGKKYLDLVSGEMNIDNYITTSGDKISYQEKVNVGGNGNDLVTKLNNYWKPLSKFIKNKFDPNYGETNETRYEVSKTKNTPNNILKLYLIGNEYIPSLAEVQKLVNDAINIYDTDDSVVNANGKDISFDELSNDSKKSLANILKELINIQYKAIFEEFKSYQLLPLYENFMTLINDSVENENVTKVNDPLSFLEIKNNGKTELISYKEKGWESIISTGNKATIKDQFKTFINLINFKVNNSDVALFSSIFNARNLRDKYLSFNNADSLFNKIDVNDYEAKLSQLRIFEKILNHFGWSFADSYNNGSKDIIFKYNNESTSKKLKDVVEDIITKLPQRTSYFKPVGETYESYWLDNIISGTNVILAMDWKLNNINQTKSIISDKIRDRINLILLNAQASQSEQASWSNATYENWDFNIFASKFSGRNGESELTTTFDKVVEDKTILAKRVNEFDQGAWPVLMDALKWIWWILLGLIGIGIITSSVVGVASKSKQVKLSAHPVIKWSLFGLIGLGVGVVVIAIVFGLLPLI